MKGGGDEVFFCLPSLFLLLFLITGEGAGEGKCSQDQSRSLPDNHFQVRAAGGLARGVGSCRDISLGIPKLDSPIRMMGTGGGVLWEGSEGVSLFHYLFLGLSPCFWQVLLRTRGCCGQGL